MNFKNLTVLVSVQQKTHNILEITKKNVEISDTSIRAYSFCPDCKCSFGKLKFILIIVIKHIVDFIEFFLDNLKH